MPEIALALLLLALLAGLMLYALYWQRRQAGGWQAVVEASSVPRLLFDASGCIRYLNPATTERLGHAMAELQGKPLSRLDPGLHPILLGLRQTKGEQRLEYRLRDHAGSWLDFLLYVEWMADGRCWIELHDISAQKAVEQALRKSQEQLRAALAGSRMAIYDLPADGAGSWTVSPEFARLLDEEPSQFHLDLVTWRGRIHPDDQERAEATYREYYEGKIGFYNDEYRLRCHSGDYRWVQSRGAFVDSGVPGTAARLVGVLIDITERKAAEQKITELANFDTLTGLANRHMLYERLEQSLAVAERDQRRLAVMFLDLDRFKTLNDTLGHSAGDRVLSQAAERLKKLLRRTDLLSRLGGDEFVIVLNAIEQPLDVIRVAENALLELALPFDVEDASQQQDGTMGMFASSGSIGISIFPEDGGDCETLIRNADTAMYQAKAAGRNNYKFYTPDMNARAAERLSLEATLRRAFAGSEFILHYQPQLDLLSGELIGAEALVRWQNAKRGLVAPGQFIPVAEESRLIIPIGNWILREACRQAREWLDMGLPQITVAVNLSPLQFQQANLCDLIRGMLEEFGLPPLSLELEVTESVVMQDIDRVRDTLNDLKRLGVRLSIDDFGTGYSSLSYLKRFSFDKLKIDRSFVADLGQDRNDEAICLAIISLAKVLGLRAIAEGVETIEQASFLLAAGCEEMQGYLASQPLPAAAFEQVLRNSQSPEYRLLPSFVAV